MHDNRIGLCHLDAVPADAVICKVFVNAGNTVEVSDAFTLDSQSHHDVCVLESCGELVHDARAGKSIFAGCKNGRRNQTQFTDSHRLQGFEGGSRDARMLDIANNGDDQVFEIRIVLANGKEIEQALRRMGNVGLTCIQNTDMVFNMACDVSRDAVTRIADDHDVNLHGLERVYGVEDAFAFLA